MSGAAQPSALDLTLISGAFIVGGVVITSAVNSLSNWRKNRREDRRDLRNAVTELLAAAEDLISGAIIFREGHHARDRFHEIMRDAWAMISIFSKLRANENVTISEAVQDWETESQIIDDLLILDERAHEYRRTVTLDAATHILPRANRFYAAVTHVTVRRDGQIAAQARILAKEVGALIDNIEARERTYARALRQAEKAQRNFRSEVAKILK